MGYWFKSLGDSRWKIRVGTLVNGKQVTKTLPPEDYGRLAIQSNMTPEEARARIAILNQDDALKRQELKRQKISERIEKESISYAVNFPEEPEFLEWVDKHTRLTKDPKNKFKSHWHRAKKVITDCDLKPEEYADNKMPVYDWFIQRCLSPGYADKIIRALNQYGKFYAKKYRVYFEELPTPQGRDREDMNDAYYEKNPEGRDARPLELAHLPILESALKREQYNFMYVSFWLGLRPWETDALLLNPGSFKYEHDGQTTIIWVYQTKLRNIPRDRRWKPIPLVEPEQKIIPDLISSKAMERPLKKTISKHLEHEKFGLYSPRKGFENLMRERGYAFENISQWLGHQSLDRTWKNYTDRKKVHWYKRT